MSPPIAAKSHLPDLTNQTVTTEQKNYLHKEVLLSEVDPRMITQGINLINKYYPGIGQMIAQPILQLLPMNPLLAKQWAGFSQEFPQNETQQDQINDANNQTKNKGPHNKNVSKLHNTEKNKHKTQEDKSDENKDDEDDGHIKKTFPRHPGGWSPTYQRYRECVNDYKCYGGLVPQITYDLVRTGFAIVGSLAAYRVVTAVTEETFTSKWVTKMMKLILKKAPKTAGVQAGIQAVKRFTNFSGYVINKGEEFVIMIGNKFCK